MWPARGPAGKGGMGDRVNPIPLQRVLTDVRPRVDGFFFDLGLHFGVILGSEFATILVFGGPKGFQEGVRKKHEKKVLKNPRKRRKRYRNLGGGPL